MRKAASAAGLADGKCGTVPKDSLARARIIPLARSQSATVTWTKTREADLSRAQQPFLSFKVIPLSCVCAYNVGLAMLVGVKLLKMS